MYRAWVATALFVLLFGLFHWLRPEFAYTREGGFRPFGIGFKHKTVLSAWVVAMVTAVFSYLAVVKLTG